MSCSSTRRFARCRSTWLASSAAGVPRRSRFAAKILRLCKTARAAARHAPHLAKWRKALRGGLLRLEDHLPQPFPLLHLCPSADSTPLSPHAEVRSCARQTAQGLAALEPPHIIRLLRCPVHNSSDQLFKNRKCRGPRTVTECQTSM